jgi:ribose-phosphate pyrophosphokinase
MILLNGKEVQFGTFPNGETHVKHIVEATEDHPAYDFFSANLEEVNVITFKYENDGDLIKLLFVKKHLDSLTVNPAELVIYYMPYSRMDRVEDNNPFTLKYVAQFINEMKFDNVFIVEPHSDVTGALVDNAISVMINFELIEEVMGRINFDPENDYLVFPDAGAQKRYHKMKYPNLVGFKERDFTTGDITGLQIVGAPSEKKEGRKAIIVDDLSSKGRTFVETSKALAAQGFDQIFLLVAHAEDSIFQGKLFDEATPITQIFTTDTILTTADYWANQKYKDQLVVFDIEDVLQSK